MTISSSLWKIQSQRGGLLRQRLLVPNTSGTLLCATNNTTNLSRRCLASSWWNAAGIRSYHNLGGDKNEEDRPRQRMNSTLHPNTDSRRPIGASLRPASRSLSSFPSSSNSTTNYNNKSRLQRRHFHATSKQEILPLIVVGTTLVVGRYSWRALQRMDAEWEDYEWKLQQWEKANRDASHSLTSQQFPDGTVAVDVGTLHVKLAHDGKTVLETREGARVTFAGVVHPDQDIDENKTDDNDQLLVGPRAWERYWDIAVAHPKRVAMARSSGQNSLVLSQVVRAALQDTLDRASIQPEKMRPVVTVPVPLDDDNNHAAPWQDFMSSQQHAWKNVLWIPEPVAAVWGAQMAGDLPLHDMDAKPLLVVDVGADTTSVSVVQKDVVQTSVTLDFGGNHFVTALLDHVLESESKTNTSLSAVRNDGMSWQRLVAAAHTAVCEMNTHNQVQLHVPYLSMDVETRQPVHLDVKVSRSVVEQKVTDTIMTDLILKYDAADGENDFLSPHVPVVPHHFASLWMSVMTQLLTRVSMQPAQLAYVLVVGGGAKQKLMESSLKECFATFQTKVVVPEMARRAELVALGASSVLPNYDYDMETGLLRREEENGDGDGENQDHWHK